MSERDYYNIPLTKDETEFLKANYLLVLEGKLPNKKEYYDEEKYRDMYRYCPNRLDVLKTCVKKDYIETSESTSEGENPLNIWKIPMALIVLFFISMFDLPYGFYTFLRIIVCLFSITFAFSYYCFNNGLSFVSITAIAIAILWNPIIPASFDKETWVCLDIIAIVLEAIMLFSSYRIVKKS